MSLWASSSDGAVAGFAVVYVAFVVLAIAAFWKVFTKAGEAGWKAIVPIYNVYVLLKIVGRPAWWLILMLIPFVNLIVWIIVAIDLAKSFGKSTGFAVGLILIAPIFMMILGFGNATYVGPGGRPAMAGGVAPPPPYVDVPPPPPAGMTPPPPPPPLN